MSTRTISPGTSGGLTSTLDSTWSLYKGLDMTDALRPARRERAITRSREELRRDVLMLVEVFRAKRTLETQAELRAAHDLMRAAAELRELLVEDARAEGLTWEQIGAALRTTRQGAWLTFKRPTSNGDDSARPEPLPGADDPQALSGVPPPLGHGPRGGTQQGSSAGGS